MAKPQILLGAFDTGPSNYLRELLPEIVSKRNWGVAYFGNNAAAAAGAIDMVDFDYAVVGGPSSFRNELDVAILKSAHDRGKKVFVIGDTPRSILRTGVKDCIADAVALVASPADIDAAVEFGYKDAAWLGYPPHWADPRTIVASTVFESGQYPTARIRIFVCGLKEAGIADNMLGSVSKAMQELFAPDDYYIYFQAHPSEIPETKDAERRKALLADPRIIEFASRENVASLMMASTFSVCTGGATAVLEGALLRLPVLYYLDDQVATYMMKQVNEKVWGPVAAGACEVATPDNMVSMVKQMLQGSIMPEALRNKQQSAFPREVNGQAVNMGQQTVKAVLDYIQNSR